MKVPDAVNANHNLVNLFNAKNIPQACMGYALGVEEVDKVVVGVDSVKQLQEIFAASHFPLPSLPNWPQPVDADLIDPSRWTTL